MRAQPADIHAFWFGALNDQGLADAAHRERWFVQSDAFDREIRTRFADTVEAARNQQMQHWLTEPQSWLCYLIVCDQFPRNLYRGTSAAFELDMQARAAARIGIDRGHHRHLSIDEQAFAYLPFEHSEDQLDQYLSVGLFASLRDGAGRALREQAGSYLRHAQQHRDTILRFGRFPYRNAALNRSPTAQELEYLAQSSA